MGKKRKSLDVSTFSNRVAARLVKLREASGLTPDELAAKVTKSGYEISPVTLRHWENGNRAVALDAVPALAKSLKVKVREFFPSR